MAKLIFITPMATIYMFKTFSKSMRYMKKRNYKVIITRSIATLKPKMLLMAKLLFIMPMANTYMFETLSNSNICMRYIIN